MLQYISGWHKNVRGPYSLYNVTNWCTTALYFF